MSIVVVSNHLFNKTHVKFPDDIVVRLNLAWMKNAEEAIATLEKIEHDVYLDYPQGRTKPPKPSITISQALDIADRFRHVKYFAISNVEDPKAIAKLRKKLHRRIQLVPKIESKRGVKNLPAIMKGAKAKFAMLDKEDMYIDVDREMELYEDLIYEARKHSKKHGFHLLELHGVVFA
jgi:pyruvate kinase